jgi:hypothetical protein
MKILFIGGPKDGQREEYESPPESVNVAEMQELIIRSHTESIAKPRFKAVRYILNKVAGHSRIFSVYTIEDMSGDEMMNRLLNNYRPET